MARLTANQKRMRDGACRNHTGKMTDLMSWSVSPFNWLCNLKASVAGSICSHCFSRRMMKRFPALAEKLARNADWISSIDLTDEDVYIFNPKSGFFRFEAYGDLFSERQIKNYFTMARVNSHLNCALWTKNPQIIKRAIDKYGLEKPANLNIIFSVAGLNSEFSAVIYDALMATGYDFIDKVFTVFDHDNGKINCGARDCATCGLCYTKNETIFVNELLK